MPMVAAYMRVSTSCLFPGAAYRHSVQWDSSGIAVYFFPRGSIPADITAGAPVPSNWGLAQARWPAASCNPFQFFYNNIAIFDTTLWYVKSLFPPLQQLTGVFFVIAVETGQLAFGVARGYPDRNRAAQQGQGFPPAKPLFVPVVLHSMKLVRLLA
jgi:hypothetical protein